MKEEKYILLIQRHFRGELNEVEQLDLESWLDQSPENRKLLQELERTWQLSAGFQASYTPDLEKGLQQLQNRIRADQQASRPVVKVRRFRVAYAAAATVLLLITAFTVWNLRTDVTTVTTAANEQRTLRLPDGSTVILNENSRLTYPRSFGQAREIGLSGEAYFDITRDEQHPFLIRTAETVTHVLGTSFNLRAYKNEAYTEVEVHEGIVQLLATVDTKHPLKLEQGARGVYQHQAGTMVAEHPKALNAVYWKDRRFRFRGDLLPQALEEINTRLHIKISLADDVLLSCPLTQNIPYESPVNMVQILADNFGASWKEIAKGEFKIEGGNCDQ